MHNDVEELSAFLGLTWDLLAIVREEHISPTGAPKPSTCSAFRRQHHDRTRMGAMSWLRHPFSQGR